MGKPLSAVLVLPLFVRLPCGQGCLADILGSFANGAGKHIDNRAKK